jgi:hypothetical protein
MPTALDKAVAIEAGAPTATPTNFLSKVENYVLNVMREHPSWGARKIRERQIRRFSGIPVPAKSTVNAVLDP